ncbi:unnamed protein product [Calypogeia fissa]
MEITVSRTSSSRPRLNRGLRYSALEVSRHSVKKPRRIERLPIKELAAGSSWPEEAKENPVAPPTTNPTANPEEAAAVDGRRSRIWKWIAILLMLVLVLVVRFLVLAVIFLILRSWISI